jgi:hypothetical protein
MRTLLIILGGLVAWGVCLGVARFAGGLTARSAFIATVVFAIIWLLAAAYNLWVGVTRAGYSVMEELPIFLLIYLLPVAVAVVVQKKYF